MTLHCRYLSSFPVFIRMTGDRGFLHPQVIIDHPGGVSVVRDPISPPWTYGDCIHGSWETALPSRPGTIELSRRPRSPCLPDSPLLRALSEFSSAIWSAHRSGAGRRVPLSAVVNPWGKTFTSTRHVFGAI